MFVVLFIMQINSYIIARKKQLTQKYVENKII